MTFLIYALVANTALSAGHFKKLPMTVVFFSQKTERSRLKRVMVHGSS